MEMMRFDGDVWERSFQGFDFFGDVKFPSLRWSFANSSLVRRRWREYRTYSSLAWIHSTS